MCSNPPGESVMIRLKVKEVAAAKGIGQGRLSRMADMDIKTIRRIYRDPYSDVSTYTLDRIAIVLGEDVRELLESVPGEPPEQKWTSVTSKRYDTEPPEKP
jgi:DNA-binding Xre family transcriptional regulator